MRTPKLDDIIGDIYDHLDNVEVDDTDFGDVANSNVEVPTITDLGAVITYYTSPLTKTPYARITWSWTRPPMHDEDGGIINPLDPLILDDINFDPVVDYMFGIAISGGTPTGYASTKGSTSTLTENHALGANITGSVYAVLKSGIIGPTMNYTAVVTRDTTAPGQPSAPTLVSTASIVTATFDGLLQGGGAQPSDYLYTEIMAGTANPPTTKVGEANGRGLYSFYATAGSTIYVQLFSYDTSLNRSVGSTIVSTVVKSVLDDTGLSTALDNKKVIYAQNADPVGNVGVTLHDGDWWFVTNATTPSKIDTMKIRAAGAWVVDAINAATVIAALSIVAGNISADAITADKILAGEIYAKLTTTGELKADVINTGIMTAAITVSGLFQTDTIGHDRVVLDNDGITLYRHNASTGNDDIVVDIPVVGDAQFFGMLNAAGLSVYGLMSLRSAGNTIEPSGSLLLNTGIVAPATAPTVTNIWDSVSIVNQSGATPYVRGGCLYGTSFLIAEGIYNSGVQNLFINQVTAAGAYTRGAYLKNSAGTNCGYGTIESTTSSWNFLGPGSFTAFGGYLYGLAYEQGVSTGGDMKVNLYKWVWNGGASDGNFVARYPLSSVTWLAAYLDPIGLTNDGTNLFMGYRHWTNSKLYVLKYTTVGAWVSTNISTAALTGLYGVNGFAIGVFDLAGAIMYAADINGVVQFVNSTTNVIDPNPPFPDYGAYTTRALGYDASGFFTLDQAGKIVRYTGTRWDSSIGGHTITLPCVYTFYDSNGTVHESKASPVTNASVKKRSKTQMSVAGWVADTSTVDSVNSLRFYLYPGTQYRPQGISTTGTFIVVAWVLSGSAPPSSSTFPSATPGFIGNPAGTLKISGDGSIVTNDLTVNGGIYGTIDHARMYKSTVGHSAAGTAYASGTWYQVTGFTNLEWAVGVTADYTNGEFVITKAGTYDIDFFQRWQDYGTANYRLGAIMVAASAGAVAAPPTGAGAGNGNGILALNQSYKVDWDVNMSSARGIYLPVGYAISFWIRSGTGSTWNTVGDTLVNKSPYVYIRRVSS